MHDLTVEENIGLFVSLLKKKDVFKNMSDDILNQVANKARFVLSEQGERVITQSDDEDKKFFVIMSGQLRAIDVSYKPPRLLNYHVTGDIIGARSIINNSPRAATVEVVIDAHLAVFSQTDWEWLSSIQPRIVDYLNKLEVEFSKCTENNFEGRQEDEVVVFATKRHILAFLVKLPVPLSFLIAPILFLLLLYLLGVSFLSAITSSLFLVLISVVPFVLIATVLTIYYYLDWRNDDFILTTKRFIHIERRLFYGQERNEAPLTRIQDVTISYTSFLNRLDYFDLRIKTAGAGNILADGIVNAKEMKELIFEEKELAMERVEAANVSSLRQVLAKRLEWEDVLEETILAIAEKEGGITKKEQTPTLSIFNYFIPRLQEIEADGTTILWRKHYWVLFYTVVLPVLFLLVSFSMFITSLFTLYPFRFPASIYTQVGFGIAVLLSLMWYIWQYDGWRRDTYLLTDSRIIDIESSSFGLGGENRGEGTFDDIQNITYIIPNFFSQVLNMGTVIIETAGSKDTFTFNRVFNPSGVQQEIFNRMILFQQRSSERKNKATSSEMMKVLGEYQYLLEKASAQGIVKLGEKRNTASVLVKKK